MEEDEIKRSAQIRHEYTLHLTISIHQRRILLAIMAAALLLAALYDWCEYVVTQLLLSAGVH